MKSILVIGGSHFIGRMLVEKLIESEQYALTIFNRGKSSKTVLPDVTYIYGDRNTDDVQQLQQGSWDVVVDMSSYLPHSVQKICENLQGRCSRYILISTCSVYDESQAVSPYNENATVLPCSPEAAISPSLEWYGHKKAECERIVMRHFQDHVIFRPALVVGKYDYTDRFYYWLYQALQKKEVIVPDSGKPVFSLSYVEDVVTAILYAIENNLPQHIYNTVSHTTLSFAELISSIPDIFEVQPKEYNASATLLHENNITQWGDLPLWIDGDSRFDNSRILQDIPNVQTSFATILRQTAEYYSSLNWHTPKYGLSEERFTELKKLLS